MKYLAASPLNHQAARTWLVRQLIFVAMLLFTLSPCSQAGVNFKDKAKLSDFYGRYADFLKVIDKAAKDLPDDSDGQALQSLGRSTITTQKSIFISTVQKNNQLIQPSLNAFIMLQRRYHLR